MNSRAALVSTICNFSIYRKYRIYNHPPALPELLENLRFWRYARGQEIEITALVRLRYSFAVKRQVAARTFGDGTSPVPVSQIRQNVEPAIRNIQFDRVAVLDQRQRTAHVAFGRYVQDAGAVRGAAHSGVGNSHHVANPLA